MGIKIKKLTKLDKLKLMRVRHTLKGTKVIPDKKKYNRKSKHKRKVDTDG